MANYPDIRTGTRFGDTSARQWQAAFHSLEGVVGMTAGPGLNIIRSGDAIEVRLDPQLERLLLPSVTVVVTEKPVEGDKALTVRRVIYGPSVPVAGEYQWADETTFVVFPEVGSVPADFADLVWAPTNEQDEPITPLPPPTLAAQFLRARRRGEFWFVEKAPQPLDFAHFYILDAGLGDPFSGYTVRDDVLRCHPMTPDGSVNKSIEVYVAKPFTLRVTPWHNHWITPDRPQRIYVYDSQIGRRLEDAGQVLRTEIMYMSYKPESASGVDFSYINMNRPIVAIRANTGLQIDNEPVVWQDINVEARHWAILGDEGQKIP